jgi:hypothetical protein
MATPKAFWVAGQANRLPYNFRELRQRAQKEPVTAVLVAVF